MFSDYHINNKRRWFRYHFVFLFVFALVIAVLFSPDILADNGGIEDSDSNCPTCGTIEGKIWRDLNWNGRREARERGISGAMIRLWAEEEGRYKIIRAQYTGRSGIYKFNDLPSGSYRVEVVEPSSPGLAHLTQTALRSPTPVIEIEPQEVVKYSFSYAGKSPAMYVPTLPVNIKPVTTTPLNNVTSNSGFPAASLHSNDSSGLNSSDSGSNTEEGPTPPETPQPEVTPPSGTPPRPSG